MTQPLYTPQAVSRPAFHLRYTWTGWPSAGEQFPELASEDLRPGLATLWETDGIRYLESAWTPGEIQLTCSANTSVSPVFFTSRIKGRLQHYLRLKGHPIQFSRKVAFRTIGDNSREEVEGYIGKQVFKEQFVDQGFSESLEPFTVTNPHVRLQDAVPTHSGRYWYNLHLVLVTESRMRFTDRASLAKLSQICDSIALKKGHRVSARSVMPDHIHIALGGNIEQSPAEIALSYMNNTAYCFGQKWIWRPGYYVGTFGEYDMGAVRRN